MSYRDQVFGKRIYNPVTKSPSVGGIKQYRTPSTNELSGKVAEFHLDDYGKILIHFLDGENLAWCKKGETFRWENYEASKPGENIYLISWLEEGSDPVKQYALLWDKETALVTCVISLVGENPDKPRLVTDKVYFGAQKLPHQPLTEKRHVYTEEMNGKRIIWYYNPIAEIMHIYCGKNHFRLGHMDRSLVENPTERDKQFYQNFLDRLDVYPEYEEPAYFIKIRDGFYFYSVTEKNINSVLPKQGGSQLLIALNAARASYIGVTVGLNRDGVAEHDWIGAPGRFSPIPDYCEQFEYPMYPLV
jgi:hypothetical protein